MLFPCFSILFICFVDADDTITEHFLADAYELITKKAEEAWTTQAMAPLDQLRKDIELNKQLFREAEKIDIPQINDAISIYLEYGKEFRNGFQRINAGIPSARLPF